MVAEGRPLTDVLDSLVRTIEAESTTGVIAAIHLLDETGSVFRQAVAPSLPVTTACGYGSRLALADARLAGTTAVFYSAACAATFFGGKRP